MPSEGSEGRSAGTPSPGGEGGWVRFASSPPVHAWPGSDARLREALRAALGSPREETLRPTDQVPEEGILVVSATHPESTAALRRLRGIKVCRLLPIALAGPPESAPEESPLADSCVPAHPKAMRAAMPVLEARLERVRALPPAEDVSAPERRELDFLRFVHTRDLEELVPHIGASFDTAFHLPVAESLLELPALEAWETLEELREKGIFEGPLEERVFLCRTCGGSRILLREVCPKCQVPSLVTEQTIHHFPCAHVGPRESFEQEGRLVCPKCQGELRHIGVDYDRPEAEQRCERCGEHWLEGTVQGRCLGCDARFTPEEARLIDLRRLRATPLLHKAAESRWSPLSTVSRILSRSLASMDAATFEILRAHTERVCRRYGRPASRIRVRIEASNGEGEPAARGSWRSRLAAIAGKIRELIRSTDAVTVGDHDTVEILLTETALEGARIVAGRIEDVLREIGGGAAGFAVDVEPLVEGATREPPGASPPAPPEEPRESPDE